MHQNEYLWNKGLSHLLDKMDFADPQFGDILHDIIQHGNALRPFMPEHAGHKHFLVYPQSPLQ